MIRLMKDLQAQLAGGTLTRRAFVRRATALGLSLGTAQAAAACARQTPTAPATTATLEQAALAAPRPTETLPWDANYNFQCPYCGQRFRTRDELEAHARALHPEAAVPTREPTPRPQPTATPEPLPAWRSGGWLCEACGQVFPRAEDLRNHALEYHARKMPAIRRVDEPTYARFIVGPVERFDQKNIVFSRTVWDEQYKAKLAAVTPPLRRKEPEPFDAAALRAGAIFVDDFVGSLHPKYTGFTGHLMGVDGLYSWDDPVNPNPVPIDDPAQMTARVKEAAFFFGASLVGICEINPLWVYSHYFERETGTYGKLEIPYKYAIVIAVEMDWKHMNGSPGFMGSAATTLGYSRMAEVAASLAKYIRTLGYPAVPSGNDTTQNIPLAIDAGLGELGRNGLLITPQFGPRQRICKVLTNLPLVPDKPIDFGLQQYCKRCLMCAHSCPAQAIQWGDRTAEPTSISNRTGILRWPVNVEKCYLFWRANGIDCANCVAACPWAQHVQRDWIR